MPADESTVVTTELLRASFEALIQHFESTHGDSVELRSDYFWSVPSPEIYDVSEAPSDLTVGQLSESLDNLTP